MNVNERFEILGKLYERRYRRLRPGKDDSIQNSSEAANVEQFAAWYGDGCLALDDALEAICLRDERIYALQTKLDIFE